MLILVTYQKVGQPRQRRLVNATTTFAAIEETMTTCMLDANTYMAARPATQPGGVVYSVPGMREQLLDEYRTGLDSVVPTGAGE